MLHSTPYMPVKVDKNVCVGCGACTQEGVCPNGALELVDGYSKITGNCTEEGVCVGVCPVGALSL